MTLSIHWQDIGFIAEAEVHSHRVDFKIYCATADGQKTTDDADKEEVYLFGFVKWDGCANWNTTDPAGSQMMRHFCSRRQLSAFGEVMARCWDWADELLLGDNAEDEIPVELLRKDGALAISVTELKEHLALTPDITAEGKPVEIWMQLDEEIAPRRVQQVYRHADGRLLFTDADLD